MPAYTIRPAAAAFTACPREPLISIPLLPPSVLEKPWMILPEVGHCHATFEAIGATTLELIGVLFALFTDDVTCVDEVATGTLGDVPASDLMGPIIVPSDPI